MLKLLARSDAARAFVAANYGVPDWATGAITRTDAAFLYEMICFACPTSIGEIGIASGVSTAFLSRVLSATSPSGVIRSFDIGDRFYADRSKQVGEFLLEAFDEFPRNVTLYPLVSSLNVPKHFDGSFDFLFIDANHDHPWPCIDLLANLILLKPGSWVALHDISLPFIMKDFPHFGPNYLFETWPGETMRYSEDSVPTDQINIGAIRTFDDVETTIAAVLDCLALPWQAKLKQDDLDLVVARLRVVSENGAARLETLLKGRSLAAKPPAHGAINYQLSAFNSWSSLKGLFSGNSYIHANRSSELQTTITALGIDVSQSRRIVFPKFQRSDEARAPMTINFSLVDSDSKTCVSSADVVLRNSREHPIVLSIPPTCSRVDVVVNVQFAEPCEELNGAWISLAPAYLS